MNKFNIKNTFSFRFLSGTAVLYLFFSCMFLFWIFIQPLEKAVTFTALDDALYYPKIAYNIAANGHCTYDGITTTNGFHPLWLVLLLPVSFLFSDPILGLKVTYVYIFLILSACFYLFSKIAKERNISVTGIFVSCFILFLNLRSFTLFFGLIESHVVLFAYLCYVFYSLKVNDKRFTRSREAFFNGLIAGISFLARIDSFLLAFSFFIVLLSRLIKKEQTIKDSLKALAAFSAGTFILILPYLYVNYLSFGRIVTVSAWMKSSSPSLEYFNMISGWITSQLTPRLSLVLGTKIISPAVVCSVIIVMIALLGAVIFYSIKKQWLFKKLLPVIDFALFALLHFIFIVIFTPWDALVSVWYLVPEILLLSLVTGLSLNDIKIRNVRILPYFVLLLLAVQFLLYPGFVAGKTMSSAKLEAAAYLNKYVPEKTRCTMYDSGIVSYFSQRDFVPLNGLAGDFHLADIVKRRDMKSLAEQYGVSILVIDMPDEKLERFRNDILYVTKTKTRYMDFSEEEKSFVILKINPGNLGEIINYRYATR